MGMVSALRRDPSRCPETLGTRTALHNGSINGVPVNVCSVRSKKNGGDGWNLTGAASHDPRELAEHLHC
jgi:hypothetical protein